MSVKRALIIAAFDLSQRLAKNVIKKCIHHRKRYIKVRRTD